MLRSLLFLAVVSVASGDTITYKLQPYRMSVLHNANTDETNQTELVYSVAGFITTDGTLGELVPENIIDYHVQVDGPEPYELTPETIFGGFESRMTTDGVHASASELFVLLGDSGKYSVFGIYAGVMGDSIGLTWSASPAFDSAFVSQPPYTTVLSYQSQASWSVNEVPASQVTVGTVPEPATMLGMLVGLVGMVLTQRKARHENE